MHSAAEPSTPNVGKFCIHGTTTRFPHSISISRMQTPMDIFAIIVASNWCERALKRKPLHHFHFELDEQNDAPKNEPRPWLCANDTWRCYWPTKFLYLDTKRFLRWIEPTMKRCWQYIQRETVNNFSLGSYVAYKNGSLPRLEIFPNTLFYHVLFLHFATLDEAINYPVGSSSCVWFNMLPHSCIYWLLLSRSTEEWGREMEVIKVAYGCTLLRCLFRMIRKAEVTFLCPSTSRTRFQRITSLWTMWCGFRNLPPSLSIAQTIPLDRLAFSALLEDLWYLYGLSATKVRKYRLPGCSFIKWLWPRLIRTSTGRTLSACTISSGQWVPWGIPMSPSALTTIIYSSDELFSVFSLLPFPIDTVLSKIPMSLFRNNLTISSDTKVSRTFLRVVVVQADAIGAGS